MVKGKVILCKICNWEAAQSRRMDELIIGPLTVKWRLNGKPPPVLPFCGFPSSLEIAFKPCTCVLCVISRREWEASDMMHYCIFRYLGHNLALSLSISLTWPRTGRSTHVHSLSAKIEKQTWSLIAFARHIVTLWKSLEKSTARVGRIRFTSTNKMLRWVRNPGRNLEESITFF